MRIGVRQMLFMVLLLAVPLASFFLVFRPQNREIEKAKVEITLKRAMLEKLRAATAQTDDLEAANAEIRQSIAAIEARLPSGKEIDTVLREVAQIAARHGLKIPEFKKADKALSAGEALEQPLEVEVTGDFDGFYRSLLDLEKFARITRLSDMKIVRTDESNGSMKAVMKLSIFYQGEPAQPVASVGTSGGGR